MLPAVPGGLLNFVLAKAEATPLTTARMLAPMVLVNSFKDQSEAVGDYRNRAKMLSGSLFAICSD